jgi:deoxyribonuclease V
MLGIESASILVDAATTMTTRTEVHQLLQHPWAVPLKRAAVIQTELASHVRLTPLNHAPQTVAGIDYARDGNHMFLAIVVMDLQKEKVIEIQVAEGITSFPDMVGYLAFRLGPLIHQSVRALYHKPELLFFNGSGVCHPRLCGIASHLGLRLKIPTIGCTTDRMAGHFEPPGEKRGDYSVVRYSPQAPAVVLRSRKGLNPIFVSPGHLIDLIGSIEQTLRVCWKFRLPEPLRRAHIEAGRFMRSRLTAKSPRV